MPEPITISAAAIAVAHFLGEAGHFVGHHAATHIVGGEAHHFFRHFLERWRESHIDPATGLPRNHDIEEAGAESLRGALSVLVLELAGRIEPKKSWLNNWAAKLPMGGLLAKELFPGAQDPARRWLEALRGIVTHERVGHLHRSLKLNDEALRRCFAEGDVCQALKPAVAEAILEWTRFELSGHTEPAEFELLVREGWDVPGARHRVTLAHAYCLFFREHLKYDPKAFRILVIDTVNDLRGQLHALGTDVSAGLKSLRDQLDALAPDNFAALKIFFTDFQQWLEPQLGDINNLLTGFQTQLDSLACGQSELNQQQGHIKDFLARGQDERRKEHGEILVALTILRTEVARGNAVAQPSLDEFTAHLARFGRQLDYLVGGLPIQRFGPPDPPEHELQLLHAKQRAIELVARDLDLGALWRWLESDATISARLLVGSAGTGKTRLAFELLLRVNGDLPHWQSSLISSGDLRRMVEKTHSADFNWPRPTLLVVDYAQTLATPLSELLRALTHRRQAGLPPLRVLLLERQPGNWFEDLLRAEDSHGPCAVRQLFEPPAPVALTPLPKGELRRQVLQQTLDRAAALNKTRPHQLPPENDPEFARSLQRAIFDQPLNLMLAALAAGELGLLPALRRERVELAEALADKELGRVERFARDASNQSQQRALRHLVACATMERGFTKDELLRAVNEELAALQLNWPDGAGDLAEVLKRIWPHDKLAVAPVEPDFVGEALVLRTLAKAPGSGADRWRDWCLIVERCCRRDPRATPATLLHAFQNFGQKEHYAEPLLAATDALIQTGLAETEPELLAGVEAALPHDSVKLRLRAVEVTRHLYQRLKAAPQQGRVKLRPEIARFANNLSNRLSGVGRRADALASAQEAVDLYRALAQENPDAFRPNLATSLNTLAARLSEVGRRADALAPAQESVEIRRALAQKNPDAFRPDLAMSLNNLANRLSEMGRRADALAPAQEAVDLYRALAQENPDAFRPNLAASLNNLANRLSEVGRRADALAPAQEAVDLYRALAQENPDAFRPDLAMSLNNLANRLSEMGRRADALAPAQESVEIRRALAQENPDAFRPNLAASLNNLANHLSNVGRRADALAPAQESVEIRRALAQENPDAFRPNLAMSLNNLANRLSEVGRRADALVPAQEAVEIRRALVQENPDAFTHNLATSLGAMSQVLAGLERHAEAVAALAEGIRVLQPQLEKLPEAFAPLMQTLCRDYLSACEFAQQEPDMVLLAPVAEVLQKLQGPPPEGGAA